MRKVKQERLGEFEEIWRLKSYPQLTIDKIFRFVHYNNVNHGMQSTPKSEISRILFLIML